MIAYGDRYDRRRRSSNSYRKVYSDAARILGVSPGVSRSIVTIVKQVKLLDTKTRVFWGKRRTRLRQKNKCRIKIPSSSL